MKYAIISDIHSNFDALEKVLDEISSSKPDKIICCGDVVGYGPQPKECIQLLQTLKNIEFMLGNHDAALAGKIDMKKFNDYAVTAVKVNGSALSAADKEFLSSFKLTHSENGILFLHGSPRDPVSEYLKTTISLNENIAIMKEKICFSGHTHFPLVYCLDKKGEGKVEYLDGDSVFHIEPENKKYIINAGSVGQPRDGDARSCFAYFDDVENTVSFRRVEYDVARVQKKMKDLKFPEALIKRLPLGR